MLTGSRLWRDVFFHHVARTLLCRHTHEQQAQQGDMLADALLSQVSCVRVYRMSIQAVRALAAFVVY
jgi:hypothetical protein